MTLPFRRPPAAVTRTDDRLTAALAGLEEARSVVRALRILVSQQKEGASALHAAEYRLHCALNRVEALGGMRPRESAHTHGDDFEPSDAA